VCLQRSEAESSAQREQKPSSCFLDFRDGELTIRSFEREPDFVAGLEVVQHLWVGRAIDHDHAFVHAELLKRAMLDGDLAAA
jgi:hypothetical protein